MWLISIAIGSCFSLFFSFMFVSPLFIWYFIWFACSSSRLIQMSFNPGVRMPAVFVHANTIRGAFSLTLLLSLCLYISPRNLYLCLILYLNVFDIHSHSLLKYHHQIPIGFSIALIPLNWCFIDFVTTKNVSFLFFFTQITISLIYYPNIHTTEDKNKDVLQQPYFDGIASVIICIYKSTYQLTDCG